jgi:anti-anti-sigma factor
LLLKREGAAMFNVDLIAGECDGHVVVALRGELDVLDAAGAAGALAAVTAREPRVIVDLAALEFIDSSGLAALVLARAYARNAGVTFCWPRHNSSCFGSLPSPAYSMSFPFIPAWKTPSAPPGSRGPWPRRRSVMSYTTDNKIRRGNRGRRRAHQRPARASYLTFPGQVRVGRQSQAAGDDVADNIVEPPVISV